MKSIRKLFKRFAKWVQTIFVKNVESIEPEKGVIVQKGSTKKTTPKKVTQNEHQSTNPNQRQKQEKEQRAQQVQEQKQEKEDANIKEPTTKSQPVDFNQEFWVKYDHSHHKLDHFSYPTILVPKKGTIIKPPQDGRNGNLGKSEASFKRNLEKYFADQFDVDTSKSLFVQGKDYPYEPDFVLWNLFKDSLVLVDIEIDEPYSGFDKKPTHTKGTDIIRNIDFLNRGWIVIRFAEDQVIQHPDECCLEIAKLFKNIIPGYEINPMLLNKKSLAPIPYWNDEEAKSMIQRKHREKIHNISEFGCQTVSERPTVVDQFNHIEDKVVDQYQKFRSLAKKKPGFTGTYTNSDNKPIKNKPTHQPIPNRPKQTVNSAIPPPIPERKAATDIETRKVGVGPDGNMKINGVKTQPTRHYGGKFDPGIAHMMKPKRNPFGKALLQKALIEKDFSFLKCQILEDKLFARGTITHENGEEYSIRIEYLEEWVPRVFIDSPKIEPSDEIHMFKDGSLCLYYPPDLKWKDNMSISKYFIPWTVEWIYFYELYKVSGKWEHEEAPGHIVDIEKKRKRDKRKSSAKCLPVKAKT